MHDHEDEEEDLDYYDSKDKDDKSSTSVDVNFKSLYKNEGIIYEITYILIKKDQFFEQINELNDKAAIKIRQSKHKEAIILLQ